MKYYSKCGYLAVPIVIGVLPGVLDYVRGSVDEGRCSCIPPRMRIMIPRKTRITEKIEKDQEVEEVKVMWCRSQITLQLGNRKLE